MNRSGSHPPFNDDTIEAAAASWLAQREEGFTPEQESGFLRWRLLDPRHAAALDRLEETIGLLGQLPELAGDARFKNIEEDRHASLGEARAGGRRRGWLRAAAGLAAVLALGFVAWQAGWWPGGVVRQEVATTTDGYQRVLLPDSSIAQLNASTQLHIQFSPQERRVALTGGEAHFNVAKDTARPFVVEAHGVRVRAVGTAFNVRLADGAVDVLVTEGVVRIERDGAPEPLVLAANERTSVPTNAERAGAPAVEKVRPEAIRAELAWQEPRFVFVEATLAEVVEKFNARNRVQLQLADPELGSRVVGGTFRHDDVETFVRMLENGGDVTAERVGDSRLVLHRVP
jgi:transmembrane sensor